jgi:hypothetical protein
MKETIPERAGLAGTKLVHSGPIWDATLEATRGSHLGPVAVLVCHGMGQQVRFETISSVAEAILLEARADDAETMPVEVHLCEANDDFLARAEVKWTKDGTPHEVHVYEAYWAPLTEGKVTYWDTVKFLCRAAWGGVQYSRPFWPVSFERWMFGGRKKLPVSRIAWIGLLIVLTFLLLQVGVIAYVSLTLAQQWRAAVTQPFPIASVGAWAKWLAALVPGMERSTDWLSAFLQFLVWAFLLAEVLFVRYFIVEFVGDVAAYISPYPYKESKFDELRRQIRKIGLNVGKVIYGFGQKLATVT